MDQSNEPVAEPEVVETTEPSQKQEDNFDDLGPTNFSLTDFIKDSPVVSDEKKENPTADEEKPAEVQEPEASETRESKKYKIAGVEFDEEELVTALEDSKNRKQWQKNLTQRSQIAASIPDDQIKLLIPYALKQRELPKDLDAVFNDPEVPKTIKYVDDDGDEFEIETSKLPKDLLETLGRKVFLQMYPDLEKMKTEVEQKAMEIEETVKHINMYQEHDATEKALRFMREHPDYAITIRKGETLKDNLSMILNSGEVHPELANANKFMMLIQHIQRYGGSLEEAYAFYEGNKKEKQKVKEQIKKNQQSDIPPEKGAVPVVKSKDEEFLDRFRDKSLQRLYDLDL